ncbi:MAG TPA: HAD family hydrolase [Candidatus Hydrogenedentes bacterium]|nr:HAD family hydrolase [Candidatus Hydrogenedentota bacterium]HOK88919.1 HAD family hydrolase [Candidatus Hydrogenedentota bacterium]HPO30576.1 HAD family hydrolase [Candidatus Hydrogenedentota bacterium]
MSDPIASLKARQPERKFLIAIDSDGCAFDTMEIKHKECFIPNIIRYWNLQPVSKYARMAAEFVNLYSKWRGINRFPALLMVFDLLAEWDAPMARGIQLPEVPNLREWVRTETKLGNPALKAYCQARSETEAPDMHRCLTWSVAVNRSVEEIVQGGLPPFPWVRECLEKASNRADMMVCSQTPGEALEREWAEQRLDHYVFAINGQEVGTKAEHIRYASEGRYAPERILMIGDAYGDLKAARANNALFFPINPGDEENSWKRLYEEGLDRFFAGTYAGAYEQALIDEFARHLPDTPPWKK